MADDGSVATFGSAARSFAALVHDIPGDRWDGPGLGKWDLRSLVGHTSRSIITVSTYLQHSAGHEDLSTAQDYYVHIRGSALRAAGRPAAVVERGRQAGRDLGDDPAATVDRLVERVRSELAGTDNRLIEVIGGRGIRLHTYLQTRTFELAVHGLDIAGAAGIRFTLPDEVLGEATCWRRASPRPSVKVRRCCCR